MWKRNVAWSAIASCLMMSGGSALSAAQHRTSAPSPSTASRDASAPTQPLLSATGVITARYPYSKPQRVLVTGADGTAWVLLIDPSATTLTKAKKPVTLAELPEGDQATVRYIDKAGELWARSIDIVAALPAAAPPVSTSLGAPAPTSEQMTSLPMTSKAVTPPPTVPTSTTDQATPEPAPPRKKSKVYLY